MIEWKLKLWRSAGAAALAGGLAACGAGEAPAPEAPAPEAAAPAAPGGGEAGEAAVGEGGGEHGEAGVADAYNGLAGDARTALRLAHLKGFLFIAARHAEGDLPADAGVLVQQGLIEVYDPAADQFGGLDIAPVREAGNGEGVSRAQMGQRLVAAMSAINAARAPLSFNHADTAARMVDIAAGLYQHVIQPDFVDPVEYQHSLGAAMAARDVLAAGEPELRAQNAAAYDNAMAELNAFIDKWPQHWAPEQPTPYREVLAGASRVRLALSPFLDL